MRPGIGREEKEEGARLKTREREEGKEGVTERKEEGNGGGERDGKCKNVE